MHLGVTRRRVSLAVCGVPGRGCSRIEMDGRGRGSGRWGWESLESGDRVVDQLGPWGSVAEVQDGASGSAGDGGGDAEQPVAEPFRFPTPCLVTGQREHPGPGLQLGRQRDDLAPDPVLRERFQGQVLKPHVLGETDPVLAPRPPSVADLKIGELPAGGVGREGGQSISVDVLEP